MKLSHEIAGKRFGLLIPLSRAAPRPYGKSYWLCRCDCGTEKEMCAYRIVKGLSLSCGCRIKKAGSKRATHGMAGTAIYAVWSAMKARCRNPDHEDYIRYGARGITVCERWQTFENFFADMGERPSPDHSIDREDNNGDYEPDNCRWATRDEQIANRSVSKIWVVDGVEYASCKAAAATFGVSVTAIMAWCNGTHSGQYHYPPNDNCWSIRKYL